MTTLRIPSSDLPDLFDGAKDLVSRGLWWLLQIDEQHYELNMGKEAVLLSSTGQPLEQKEPSTKGRPVLFTDIPFPVSLGSIWHEADQKKN